MKLMDKTGFKIGMLSILTVFSLILLATSVPNVLGLGIRNLGDYGLNSYSNNAVESSTEEDLGYGYGGNGFYSGGFGYSRGFYGSGRGFYGSYWPGYGCGSGYYGYGCGSGYYGCGYGYGCGTGVYYSRTIIF